jgi:hypothetical protein
MIVYVLRHFDTERCDPGETDTFNAEIIQIFLTKQLLFDYCQEEKIELDLDFEWDTSWQNYACNTWIVRGYDYIKLDLLDLFKSCIGNKISGESLTNENSNYDDENEEESDTKH